MARARAGWERTGAIVAAGVATLLAVPVVVAGVLFAALTSLTLEGCDDLDLGQSQAGVSARPDGAVVVHPGPCRRGAGFASVRVQAADGTTVWLAEATNAKRAGTPVVDNLVVGQAPAGFADVVPLTAPLDPSATYTVQLARVTSATAATFASTPVNSQPVDDQTAGTLSEIAYTAEGQSATFRPAALDPATVTYRGKQLTTAEFADLDCVRPADG